MEAGFWALVIWGCKVLALLLENWIYMLLLLE